MHDRQRTSRVRLAGDWSATYHIRTGPRPQRNGRTLYCALTELRIPCDGRKIPKTLQPETPLRLHGQPFGPAWGMYHPAGYRYTLHCIYLADPDAATDAAERWALATLKDLWDALHGNPHAQTSQPAADIDC